MGGTVRVRTLAAMTGVMLAALVVVLTLWMWQSADAAPGDDDTTFVPITPCRLFDLRPDYQVGDRATPLGAGETHTLTARGDVGDCTGIPTTATAVSLNVTALDATAHTFLTLWPHGAPQPDASSLNPAPGQPPAPNAVTVALSTDGRFDIYNLDGTINVLADINGYYTPSSLQDLDDRLSAVEAQLDALTALEAQIDALETRVAALEAANTALEAKTAAMSTTTVGGHPVVRFTGVNVQIVDGTGDTRCGVIRFEDCNGLGNLIVGYHEDTSTIEARTGAHNIVTGTENDYTSHSGIIAGSSNTTSGEYASVTGGFQNTASGGHASVTGGNANTASGPVATVSGGWVNTASGISSTVTGGGGNKASNAYASVSGGYLNTASGDSASVSGGYQNTASGNRASVSGGWNCTRANANTWGVGGPGSGTGCAPSN